MERGGEEMIRETADVERGKSSSLYKVEYLKMPYRREDRN